MCVGSACGVEVEGKAGPSPPPPPAATAAAAAAAEGELQPRCCGSVACHRRWKSFTTFFWSNYLPIGLVVAVFFGAVCPWPGEWFSRGPTASICIACIFLISGLQLRTDQVRKAVTEYKGIAYGLLAILVLTPLLGLALVELPFAQREFAVGLAVFVCMPTTLSSGAALVAQAAGNFALALLLTVSTNVAAIFTIPFVISLVLGSRGAQQEEGGGGRVSIDPLPLLLKLLYSILAPLALGKALQQHARVSATVKQHKKRFSLASNSFLIVVPWLTISKYSDDLQGTRFTAVLLILVAAVLIHAIYLLFNALCLKGLRLPFEAYKAVLIVTSQKTLPVAITVISFLDPMQVGSPGLVSIPPILSHLTQIVIDSVLVARWARQAAMEKAESMKVELVVGGPSSDQPSSEGVVEQTLGASMEEIESTAAMLTAAEEHHV